MVFSREEGYYRKDILDYEPKGYEAEGREFRPKRGDKVEDWWPDWASHNLCLWGSAGQLNDRSRIKPFAYSLFLKLTRKQYNAVANIDWEPLIARYKTTSPMITAAEAITQINKTLKDG